MIEKEFVVEDVTPHYSADNPYDIESVTITVKKDIGIQMSDILIKEYTVEEKI